MYDIIRNQPVAKFFYKGTHSHPVQRTILITECNRNVYKGYEVREGATVRDVDNAPIKTFRKDKIANTKQVRGGSKAHKAVSTLRRMSMSDVNESGF